MYICLALSICEVMFFTMHCIILAHVNYVPMSSYGVLWHRSQTSKFDLIHPIYHFHFMVCGQTCLGLRATLSALTSMSCGIGQMWAHYL